MVWKGRHNDKDGIPRKKGLIDQIALEVLFMTIWVSRFTILVGMYIVV